MKDHKPNEPIARFMGSHCMGTEDFGFDIYVYLEGPGTFRVNADENCSMVKMNPYYSTFSDFLEDLSIKNPLWFTYYRMEIPEAYKSLVEKKLSQAYEQLFKWLFSSMMNTPEWELITFNSYGDKKSAQLIRKESIIEKILEGFQHSGLSDIYNLLLKNVMRNKEEGSQTVRQRKALESWNGFCPESWIKGKKVKMRLNDMDLYESEETGLQVAVYGPLAVILKSRGYGEFRQTPCYGDDISSEQMFVPQMMPYPPFVSRPFQTFANTDEIELYINSID